VSSKKGVPYLQQGHLLQQNLIRSSQEILILKGVTHVHNIFKAVTTGRILLNVRIRDLLQCCDTGNTYRKTLAQADCNNVWAI
jgi:hypothetical protein